MPQSLAMVYLHLVFSTKGRRPVLDESVRPELSAYIGGILRDIDCPAVTVGGTADHTHILFRLSRTMAPASVVRPVKAGSSRWLRLRGCDFGKFRWQRGYGLFSIGQKQVEAVAAYIDQQEAHHRSRTFQDEFREFLRRHNLTWDERYVWD